MKPLGCHNYFVYILTNKHKNVLYVGVTNDLKERLHYHCNPTSTAGRIPFTTKYNCTFLVYFERFEFVEEAISREKALKGWKRLRKDQLIESFNPNWTFLNYSI